MMKAFRLGGFYTSHLVQRIADSGTLPPMLAYVATDGTESLECLSRGDNVLAWVAGGKSRLQSNDMNASSAALLFGGQTCIGGQMVSTIIVEIRSYSHPNAQAILAVPYTSVSRGRSSIHKPKVLAWSDCQELSIEGAFKSFFEGVKSQQQGAAIWRSLKDGEQLKGDNSMPKHHARTGSGTPADQKAQDHPRKSLGWTTIAEMMQKTWGKIR
jgi:hypothetical protein